MNPITQKAYPAPVSRDSARPLVNDFIKFTNKNNDDEDADDVIDTSANPVQWIDLLHGYQSKEPDNFSVYGTKFGIPDPNNPGKVISINWEDLEGKEFDCIPVVNFTQTSTRDNGFISKTGPSLISAVAVLNGIHCLEIISYQKCQPENSRLVCQTSPLLVVGKNRRTFTRVSDRDISKL